MLDKNLIRRPLRTPRRDNLAHNVRTNGVLAATTSPLLDSGA